MQVFVPGEVLDQLGLIPLATLIAFYGWVLYTASNWLSAGSSMLLGLYGPGIVGGFVIPILGAVPDAVMILISGIGQGSDARIQEQLAVGVGTLAGSTIMLITVPWAVGVYLGRRDLDPSGRAAIDVVDGAVVARYTRFTWTATGVTVFAEIPFLARSMMATVLLYLIIQIPALYYYGDPDAGAHEHVFAVIGLVSSVGAFLVYSTVQLRSAQGRAIVKQMQMTCQRTQWRRQLIERVGGSRAPAARRRRRAGPVADPGQFPPGKSLRLLFRSYDLNGDGHIDRAELRACLHGLGMNADDGEVGLGRRRPAAAGRRRPRDSSVQVGAILDEMDTGDDDDGHGAGDQRISFGEFERFFSRALGLPAPAPRRPGPDARPATPMATGLDIRLMMDGADSDGWSDDCDELDLDGHGADDADVTDEQIRRQAFKMLALGGLVVTVFSFPMVDTIGVFASKAGVGAFYVSFVVTPLASNASEVIAALQFASRRSARSMSLTFGTLYGAANMNNTFTLSVFLAVVAVRGLAWTFTGECLAILAVTVAVGLHGARTTVRMWQAGAVLALYPASIGLVWLLNSAGL